MFGAVSLARSLETMRSRRAPTGPSDRRLQAKAENTMSDRTKAGVHDASEIPSSSVTHPVTVYAGRHTPITAGPRRADRTTQNAPVEVVARSGESVHR